MQDPSFMLGGLNEEVFFGWVSLNSSVSRGLLWVSLVSVSQFSVIKSKKFFVPVAGRTMSKFTLISKFQLS